MKVGAGAQRKGWRVHSEGSSDINIRMKQIRKVRFCNEVGALKQGADES